MHWMSRAEDLLWENEELKKEIQLLKTIIKIISPKRKEFLNMNINKYKRHMEICEQLNKTYEIKNIAYGDAFSKTFQELGIISSITRMQDKFTRLKALALGAKNDVSDEGINDTLMDLANYCLMTLIEIENEKMLQNENTTE